MSAARWPAGLVTPLVTPLERDVVDRDALGRVIGAQIDAGVGGLVIAGGTGEYGALSLDERMDLTTAAATLLGGRLPFIVQTGALATRDSIALTAHAKDAGAAGALVASPFGEPISWRERLRFYEQLGAAVDLPIMIYNTPPSGLLSVDQVHELAGLPNVSAIKDSSGNATFLLDLLEWAGPREFRVYVGMDSFIDLAITNGAAGSIVGTGNLIPREIVQAIQICRHRERDEAQLELLQELRAFMRFMEQSPSYVGLCKLGVSTDGIEVGDVRPPYLMPEEDEQQEFTKRLDSVRRTFSQAAIKAL